MLTIEEIKALEVGDIIYECDMGYNAEVEILSVPTTGLDSNAYDWEGKNTQSGRIINFRVTEGFGHYGPKLYREPQYAYIEAGKEPEFRLTG